MAEKKYSGIVLAGGKSFRMGMDKGMIQWKGKTLAEHAIETISPLCFEVVISANSNDYDPLGYPVINDQYPDSGPIGGILSCLNHLSTELNIVIPIDMPNVTTEIYRKLTQQEGNYDIIVARDHDSWYQPLCSIFNRSIIPVMEEQVSKRVLGIPALIRKVRTRDVQFQLEQEYYNKLTFFNINSQADLDAIS
jgi:molybdopterin-guanine dinucleotide biosynthesis protein A